jgi:hypothetical protein
MTAKPEYRVKIEYDNDPDLSWLEQWDTPEKYYGGVPKCSHGKPMEYRCGHTWESHHPTNDMCCDSCYGDYGCATDDCPCHLCTEFAEYDGHDGNRGGQIIKQRDGLGEHNLVPFDVYETYWGNPECHTFLYYLIEKRGPPCDTCNSYPQWETIDALHGIDFMDDACPSTGTFDLAEIKAFRSSGTNEEKYLFGMIWDVIRDDVEKGE